MMWLERLFEILVLGIRNLLRNKLRSFLTMLGMIFGVGSVIAMLSVGAGARHEILAQMSELGVTNIIVNSLEPTEEAGSASGTDQAEQLKRYGIKFRDMKHLRDTVPGISRILPVNLVRERVWYGSKRVDCQVLGVRPDHLAMFRLEVGRGRPFTALDDATGAKVCVVRRSVLEQFETLDDPLGMTVRIGDFPYRIVGVLEDEAFQSHTRKALALGDKAFEVYIPYEASMRTFGTMTIRQSIAGMEMSEVELDQLIVQASSADRVSTTARIIKSVFQHFHDGKDYEIVVPLELLRQTEKTQQVFSIVMVLIAGISLLVGGIGIVNIMLATITERTKEIGIRRALGAQRGDIVLQFLLETVAIAAIGGLLGCLMGAVGIFGIVQSTDWHAVIAPEYVVMSLAISCSVGIIFGIYPARRAAMMDPITALRHD